MTSPAAIGLTYGGTNIQEAGYGIFLWLVRGLNEPASVRGDDLVIPAKVGRLLGLRVKDRRTIILEGIITGTGATYALELSSFRAKMTTFATLFDPTVSRTLEATLEDATTRSITARTLNYLLKPINDMATLVSVELESVTPEWA